MPLPRNGVDSRFYDVNGEKGVSQIAQRSIFPRLKASTTISTILTELPVPVSLPIRPDTFGEQNGLCLCPLRKTIDALHYVGQAC